MHEVAVDRAVIVFELVGPSRCVSPEERVEASSRVENRALGELDVLGDVDDGRSAGRDGGVVSVEEGKGQLEDWVAFQARF